VKYPFNIDFWRYGPYKLENVPWRPKLALPVSVNSYTGVLNSYTGVCEIVYWDESILVHKHRYTSSQTPVYEFANTGIRVRKHRYTSSQTPVYEFKTPVYEFADTGIRVRKHRYTSSQTPVYEFTDTGIRVLGHRKREFSDTGSAS